MHIYSISLANKYGDNLKIYLRLRQTSHFYWDASLVFFIKLTLPLK